MAARMLCRLSMTNDGPLPSVSTLRTIARNFNSTSIWGTKKIDVSKSGNTTVIKGVKLEPKTQEKVRTIKAPSGCPLCEFQNTLTYTDVLILQQFISPDGHILPMHVTGMCFTMQWKLDKTRCCLAVRRLPAGLLPNYKPNLPINEDPTKYDKNYKWRKNNVYYEDFSIENPL
ncbi:unnamed protein product [Candidula unifasciata]|uniref:Mitochondrial ribosomal protein S18A n=1 Tax=Candidula unifasciata TaxID=100452 RepID=A0A8S3Z8X3_9EUPU|nr:unnamed protein product [Candidula unifasciata]